METIEIITGQHIMGLHRSGVLSLLRALQFGFGPV